MLRICLAEAVKGRQTVDYRGAVAAVAALACLDGFVCLGPAPGAEGLTGTTWISALPDLASDPTLDLQANLARLRKRRLTLRTQPSTAALPSIVGVLHYEAAYQLIPKLAPWAEEAFKSVSCPAQAGLYSWCMEFDHDQHQASLSFHDACPRRTRQKIIAALTSPPQSPGAAAIGRFRPLQDADSYKRAVARIGDYIRAGDCYQANLSQQFEATIEGSGWVAFKALSRLFPTPQSAFLALDGSEILSLSPEIFMNIDGGSVETRPIKGTRPRGLSAEEDAALALALERSEKDRAENLMIVDLLRNDLGRFCRTGSVCVTDLFKLESYANVHHLVSTVKGQLKEGVDALDALVDGFPGGSITGAPKIRAMEIIAELEPHRRGPYCGSVFRWDAADNLHSNIAIRTLWREGNRIRCWGGGGIVHDSDPDAEYAETLIKVELLMETLEGLAEVKPS